MFRPDFFECSISFQAATRCRAASNLRRPIEKEDRPHHGRAGRQNPKWRPSKAEMIPSSPTRPSPRSCGTCASSSRRRCHEAAAAGRRRGGKPAVASRWAPPPGGAPSPNMDLLAPLLRGAFSLPGGEWGPVMGTGPRAYQSRFNLSRSWRSSCCLRELSRLKSIASSRLALLSR
jgi:hypothetical protein